MYLKTHEPLRLYTFTVNGRDAFAEWLHEVEGSAAFCFIRSRIRRIAKGVIGDAKAFRFLNKPDNPLLYELRINCHGGYRIYATRCRGGLVLLSGGSKRRQNADIGRASELFRCLSANEGEIRRLNVAFA